jgi:outer membrane biosynthesis protein TonB
LTQNQAKIYASKPPAQTKPTTPAKPTKATKKPVKKVSKKPVVAKPRQTVAQKIEPQLKQQSLVKTAAQRNQPIKEAATYDKLNLLFESYIDLLEASSVPQGGGRIKGAGLSQTPNAIRKRETRAANKASQAKPATPTQQAASQQDSEQIMSISQYFKENFLDSFLQGIDMTLAKPKIDALLKNLPQLYKSGQLKKELEDIGNIAFTLARK